ncbi:MAG: type II toxin-antitoxin system PemK/MazF family toxin [Okeania sp. SIO3C4]|nr:type II toxin-antitoxin system PemK/MazF family toxin [Okeania sp. SIO3B3]NER08693.1 type II toxin-antitoxin system PemK/MazF family toxin [Okeania sp. SIO3C4]
MNNPKRGEVWLVQLDPTRGHFSYQLLVISTSACLRSIPQESQRLEILNFISLGRLDMVR